MTTAATTHRRRERLDAAGRLRGGRRSRLLVSDEATVSAYIVDVARDGAPRGRRTAPHAADRDMLTTEGETCEPVAA
jgi:hypothetical protein